MHITAQCAHHILGVKCTVVKILQLCSESIPSPDRAGSRTRRVREKHTLREHRESRLSSRLHQAPLPFQTIQDRRSLLDSGELCCCVFVHSEASAAEGRDCCWDGEQKPLSQVSAELTLELETIDNYLSELIIPEVTNSTAQAWGQGSL